MGGQSFTLNYDAENRLVEVKKNGVTIAQFTFDGDGKRVKSVVNGTTTTFIGAHYELTGSQVTKYYFAGATRVAMRKYVISQNMTVEYLLGDHLGSTSLTTDADGVLISEIRYKAWGETRYAWTNAPANTSPAYELVKYQFTGQYSYDAEFGLLFYNARWLDPVTGRFAQADSIVPTSTQGTQAWDRYAFVNNNPVRYTDPTGNTACSPDERDEGSCEEDSESSSESGEGNSVPTETCQGLDVTNCITYQFEITDAELYAWSNTLFVVAAVEAGIAVILGLTGAGVPGAIYLGLEAADTASFGDYISDVAKEPGQSTTMTVFFNDKTGPLQDNYIAGNDDFAQVVTMPLARIIGWGFDYYHQLTQ